MDTNIHTFVSRLWKSVIFASVLFCGSAQAMLSSFEGYRVASDEELDTMRGGFEFNANGMQFLLAFTIDKLSYINGELVAHTSFNLLELLQGQSIMDATTNRLATATTPPSALVATPSSPSNQAVATASLAPRLAANQVQADTVFSAGPAPTTPGNTSPTPHVNPDPAVPVTASDVIRNVSNVNGVTLIQNGPGNGVEGQALNNYLTHVIQNTVNDQVLRNVTILNATLATRALAAAAELSAALNRGIAAATR